VRSAVEGGADGISVGAAVEGTGVGARDLVGDAVDGAAVCTGVDDAVVGAPLGDAFGVAVEGADVAAAVVGALV
jgi:hypothetical protein